jgi:hypothetical protein
MTTPQNEFYMLGQRIRHLTDLFESEEEGNNIFDTVKQIDVQMGDIICSMQRQENTMNLILKLLNKD